MFLLSSHKKDSGSYLKTNPRDTFAIVLVEIVFLRFTNLVTAINSKKPQPSTLLTSKKINYTITQIYSPETLEVKYLM